MKKLLIAMFLIFAILSLLVILMPRQSVLKETPITENVEEKAESFAASASAEESSELPLKESKGSVQTENISEEDINAAARAFDKKEKEYHKKIFKKSQGQK